MNEFWTLASNAYTDPVLLRIYRWMMQWPESVVFPTILDPMEISRASGLTVEVIETTLRRMVDDGFLTIQAEREDGVKWILFALNRPGRVPDLAAREPRVRVPREKRREVNLGLRWKILERDGKKCRACGVGAEDGAKLVIDHIKPFSKGGLTVEDNLQVLCQDCNAGKCNRWPELALA